MKKKSKRNVIIILIIVIILILLLRNCCHSPSTTSSSSNSLQSSTMADTSTHSTHQDSSGYSKDTIVKKEVFQHQKQHQNKTKEMKKKSSKASKKSLQNTALFIQENLPKDTLLGQKDTSTTNTQSYVLQDTLNTPKNDTIVRKEEAIKQDTHSNENQGAIAIQTHKPKQDTLSVEYIQQVKSFFSSVIIRLEGLDKNNQILNQLKAITHFKVFVKMSTEQPLNDDFLKKIFVRISDSTTGKLIAFKGLSTMMQSITLHNMQEIDYTLAQQANFDNEEKSSTIEQAFERLNSFKPKTNITIRTEVFCQGIKIGEKMTHFLVDNKKAN